MLNLLLIDDDVVVLPSQVRHTFPAPDHRVDVVSSGAAGIERLRTHPPDVILLDLHLPDGTGLELFERIRAIDARIPVIFVTMARTADTAIDAMKRGAFDYLTKPLDLNRLKQVVSGAADVARLRVPVVLAEEAATETSEQALSGTCPAMLEVYKAIGRVAAQDVTVLITGESGTGKELVARALYQHSSRAKEPFLALNCAAIPEALLESELFGHERGAFTGADRRRIGKFEQCNGGTILLDEIGDMPIALQAKILRLLQEQTFERVGGTETIKTDVRIIASTHRNLVDRAHDERFRMDLYYRLSVFSIHIPPLRERGDDLALLVEQYVRRFNRQLGREITNVAPEAVARLRAHDWPGNVRELQSVLKKALLQATGNVLLPAFLPELTPRRPSSAPAGPPGLNLDAFVRERLVPDANDVYAETHERVDRLLFERALEFTQGNHRDAARVLGLARETMRVKMRAVGLPVTHPVESDEHEAPDEPASGDGADRASSGATMRDRVEAFERGLLADAFAASGGNQSETARRLGAGRATIIDKLRRHGLIE